jgi:hypothetical protein
MTAGNRFSRFVNRLRPAKSRRPAEPAESPPTDNAPGPSDTVCFSKPEQERIRELNDALVKAWWKNGSQSDVNAAMQCYWRFLAADSGGGSAFEITNHRIFRSRGGLLIPYSAKGRIAMHRADGTSDEILETVQLPGGALVTDRFLLDLAGLPAEAIDLWQEMHRLRREDMPPVRITRLRDLAALLERLNACGSQYEAIYLLRNMVVQLYIRAHHRIGGAKNLLPEITRIRSELNRFLNGPFSHELRLSARILVRRISGLVVQPKLIDQLFQDTLDLAEVHARGSDIANEIRRRAHHELGRNTLSLAQAYLDWLETGNTSFPDPRRDVPCEADEAVRGDAAVLSLTRRIVENLERLLGRTQLAERIDKWRDEYSSELLRCESMDNLQQELESLLRDGVHGRNRWVYLRHLRNLSGKAQAGAWDPKTVSVFEDSLASLQGKPPDERGFKPAEVERKLRLAVGQFSTRLLRDHQDALFDELDILVDCSRQGQHFETFKRACSLRRRLEETVGDAVFESQRYLLHRLDCILEELGYVALRQVASDYAERRLDLPQCLRIVSLCAANLDRDGLTSRQILDLSVMLVNRIRTPAELLDVLAQIQRSYHKLIHRVHDGYEIMARQQGFEPGDVRTMLNNCQRELYDLNSLIHFADLARAYVSSHASALQARISQTRGERPWDFVHLSHAVDIAHRIDDRDDISLQARFGGKGCGLMYIAHLGIPTRDGFIIPTVLPRLGLHSSEQERFEHELFRHTRILEADIRREEGTELHLGDPARPLLLAVRGGSAFSMPGMLTTVVFVGMTWDVCRTLAEEDEWFAWDAFRRFLVTFAMSVWNFDLEALDLVEKAKRQHGVSFKADLPGRVIREICEESVQALRGSGHADLINDVLNDAELQLKLSVQAVIASWNKDRARRYRAVKHISDGWHTGVIVQQMASGNRSNVEELRPGMDEMGISLTGVIPHTCITGDGMREFTGDIKFSACGDDLVGGMTDGASLEPVAQLHTLAPMLERRLSRLSYRLRHFLGSDVEVEFTVERGVLSVLQTRTAMIETRGSTRTFAATEKPVGRGIGIRGGAFRGMVAFDEQDARELAALAKSTEGVDGVLLLLENPVPDEIPLILSVDGLLAAKGGSTSHAAVAVHSIDDRPYTAIMGVNELRVHGLRAQLLDAAGEVQHTFACGDVLSIHGRTGEVFAGSLPVVEVDN